MASLAFTASASVAAECPPDRPLCRLLSAPTSSTTTVPTVNTPSLAAPALPPVTVPPPPPAPATPRSVPAAAQRLLDLVNGERSRAGLGRLTSRDDVVTIALGHSHRMATAGDIFHNDSYFTDSVQRQLDSQARGENVAQNSSVDDTHTRLMNSPGHRANILDPRFTVAGFAVVQAPDGRYFTTQNFLQPSGAPAPPSAQAAAPATVRPRSAPAAAGAAQVAAAPSPVDSAAAAPPVVSTAAEVTAATPDGGAGDGPEAVADVVAGGELASSSTPPGRPGGQSTGTWVPAALLLALVALGTVQVGRQGPWRSTAPR